MRTNQAVRGSWSAAACVLALLTLTIGTAMAVPSTTAYHFSSHPMISGTVVSVNDHQMVVNTDQGEQVTLEVDSRTMAPRDLAPGMVMRTEFLALEDCRLYAQRIMAIRSGTSTDRLQAYANTDDGDALAGSGRASGSFRAAGHEGRVTEQQTIGEHSPGATVHAVASTADYRFSTRPMMSGLVESVNDHRLVMVIDQGQRVALVMDSRTMVPREVAPGSDLRVAFTAMKDGRYYAKRVIVNDRTAAEREQAYAHTRDSDVVAARSITDCGYTSAGTQNTITSSTMTSALERREIAPAAVAAQAAPVPAVETAPETLPQTASQQPLLLLLGLLALGSSGVLMGLRRFRNV